MPKFKNVTKKEIEALESAASDVLMTLHDINDQIEKGYCDEVEKPVKKARTFGALARAAADLTVKVLSQSSVQEQRAELETLLRRKKEAETA